MEYRRLIKFGNSSYVVSVPKDWLRKNHLEKGDMVYMNENGNNELVLVPNLPQQERELKEITINVDGKNIRTIKRDLISAYLNNYFIVKLSGKDVGHLSREIRDTIQNLMALEITEQTKDLIVTQDFLNMTDVSLTDLIRKMDIITRAMISDLEFCFDQDLSMNIHHREQDVSRMSFVVLRAVRRGLQDPEYAKKLKNTSLQLFELWNVTSHIDYIADHLFDTAQLCLANKQLVPKEKTFAQQAIKTISFLYTNVMKAYYTKNLDLANDVSNTKNALLDTIQQTKKRLASLKDEDSYLVYGSLLDRFSILAKEINKIARRIYS